MLIPFQDLLAAYSQGLFPMGQSDHDTRFDWFRPTNRGILPLDVFHIPRRLRRRVRSGHYTASLNSDFNFVIQNCARREDTWINRTIINSYLNLHRRGFAHSIESREDGRIIGGLYGVAFGGVFFGESMFS
ncbi:MAG: leucyl/phenylalanyl-tRNA--protein transferase [Rhodobacteraceae bacterium]|nr:leucyl/phenylalanyl-tRNA--protein transferase [Paracoccaceae bacterium]